MIKDGVKVNFDRIMRVTLWYGDVPATSTSADTSNPQTVILEYAPLDNAAYCPNMQATINDITNPMNKNGQPGFTAEFTITNPDDGVRRLIANNIVWPIFNEASGTGEDLLKAYYASRVRIKIEAGYWDNEGEIIYDGAGNVVGDTRRAYTTLFQGVVNSSVSYRKGIDNYLTLECHNLDYNQINQSAIQQFVDLSNKLQGKLPEYTAETIEESLYRSARGVRTWDKMAKRLLQGFSVMRPNPEYKTGSAVTTQAPLIPVTTEDKERTDWYQVIYIYTPARKDERNEELRVRLTEMEIPLFYTTMPNLNDMLYQLSNYHEANVNFEIDDDYAPGLRTLFVWPRGAEIKFTSAPEADIQIVNYQNLLETPSVNGSGSLTIRMMLNPECRPQRSIALRLDDAFGEDQATAESSVIKANRGLRESISFSGAGNPYAATIQGAYALSVYAQQLTRDDVNNKGYMFNIGFPILRCTHVLQTRGNKWETTVITIPMATGIYLE